MSDQKPLNEGYRPEMRPLRKGYRPQVGSTSDRGYKPTAAAVPKKHRPPPSGSKVKSGNNDNK